MSESMLSVGGLEVPWQEAADHVRRYLDVDGEAVFGYPYYDRLSTTTDVDDLVDGDFLAPALLNAPVTLEAFKSLKAMREILVSLLQKVPADCDLVDAKPQDFDAVADLFALLDDSENFTGVKGAVLSKVLHRKRPRIVPLYDRKIRTAYRDVRRAPIPIDKNRSWSEFILLLMGCMRADLLAAPKAWDTFAAGVVSPLRALDIVAWSCVDRFAE